MAGTGSSELELLRESTRGFLAREAPPSAVRAGLERPRELDRAAWARAAEMGWIAALGVSLPYAAAIAEELGRALYGGPFLGCALAAAVHPGLDGLADGAVTAAWCELEAAGGETAAGGAGAGGGETAAGGAGAGDGETAAEGGEAAGGGRSARDVVTGVARHVFDADVADVLVVSAGPATYAVAGRDASVTVEPGLDLTRTLCTVRFDAAPATRVGGDAAARGREVGALLASADAVGVAARLLEMTVEYAKQRTTFGRTLASYQAVKHKCADMLCWVEGARVAVAAAAAGDARAVSVAKAYATEHCARVAGEALQIHGGIGFTWEHDLHLYLRRAKADEAMFGTPADHYALLGAC